MSRKFNVTGLCLPELHYMADIKDRLEKIKDLVDQGEYLTINRARQFGKTTTLWSLKSRLSEQYCVFLISFEGMTRDVFRSETAFCKRFYSMLSSMFKYEDSEGIPADIIEECNRLKVLDSDDNNLFELSEFFTDMCMRAEKRIVLMIDEVDQASNHEVFLGFLGILRDRYLKRMVYPTFQSVILAGVYDIKNIKMKIWQDGEHQYNSPWNMRESNESSESLLSFDDCPWDHREFAPYDIAADFNVNMSLSVAGIEGMIAEYEKDFCTGMDVSMMARYIYDYTSGYPFLVSRICKVIDEDLSGSIEYPDRTSAWTKSGFLSAVRILLAEENTLFSSLDNKLLDYPDLKRLLWDMLLNGKTIEYVPGDMGIRNALMFGFVVLNEGTVHVANRIFEIRLYNGFLAEKSQNNEMAQAAVEEKNQFVEDGHLDMERVIEKFVHHYADLFGGAKSTIKEANSN